MYYQYTQYTVNLSNLSQPLMHINQSEYAPLHEALCYMQYTTVLKYTVTYHSMFSGKR